MSDLYLCGVVKDGAGLSGDQVLKCLVGKISASSKLIKFVDIVSKQRKNGNGL